jgi:hypothetical protein
MHTRPNAADLLLIARETFVSDLMPHLPETVRYEALMVANAMANAERECAAGEASLRSELERLRVIYPAAPDSNEPVDVQLDRINRRLAVDIRKGTFARDRALREQIRTHLVQTAIERLRETNPKYLQKEGLA